MRQTATSLRSAPTWRPNPDPERCIVRLQSVSDIAERDGGFVFSALAQAYGVVNDRLMIFRAGSGAKTIAERVPAGRVKIHDGHPWNPNSSTIVGKVLEAAETDAGVTYTGFLSSTERDLAVKLGEGVMDENSLELYVLREARVEVPLDDVPQIARRWAEISASGLAVVREVQEWMWLAIGLLGSSSQGARAIVETPRLVPYQDLKLASRSATWTPKEAAERVAIWSKAGRFGASESSARRARAFLARADGDTFLGQIADVVDGDLVVVPDALGAAWLEVEALAEKDAATALAAARVLGRYEQRLLTEHPQLVHPGEGTAPTADESAASAPATPPAEALSPAAETEPPSQAAAGPASPPTEKVGSDAVRETEPTFVDDAAREHALRELQADCLTVGLPDPRSSSDDPTSASSGVA